MVALRRALAWIFAVPATRLALLLPVIAVPAAAAIVLHAFGPVLLARLATGAAVRIAVRLLIDAAHATALAVIFVEAFVAAREDAYSPLPLAWLRYRDRMNVFVRHLVVTLPVFAATGFWLWLMAGFLGASRLAEGGLTQLPFLILFAAMETLVTLIGFPPLGLLVIVSLFLCGYAALLLGALLDGQGLSPHAYWQAIRPHWGRWLVLIAALHVVYGFLYMRVELIAPVRLFGPEPIPTFHETVQKMHAPPPAWTETWRRDALSEAVGVLGVVLIGFGAGILVRAQRSEAEPARRPMTARFHG